MSIFGKILRSPLFKFAAMAALAIAAPAALPALMGSLGALGSTIGGLAGMAGGSGLTGAFAALAPQLGSIGGMLSGTGLGTIGQFLWKASSVMQLAQMGGQLVSQMASAFQKDPGMDPKLQKQMRDNATNMFASRHAEILRSQGIDVGSAEAVRQAVLSDPQSRQVATSLDVNIDDYIKAVAQNAQQQQPVNTVPDATLNNLGFPPPRASDLDEQIRTYVENLPETQRNKSGYNNQQTIDASEKLAQPQPGKDVEVPPNAPPAQPVIAAVAAANAFKA